MKKYQGLRILSPSMNDSYSLAELYVAFENEVFAKSKEMDISMLRETLRHMDDRPDDEVAPRASWVWQRILQKLQEERKVFAVLNKYGNMALDKPEDELPIWNEQFWKPDVNDLNVHFIAQMDELPDYIVKLNQDGIPDQVNRTGRILLNQRPRQEGNEHETYGTISPEKRRKTKITMGGTYDEEKDTDTWATDLAPSTPCYLPCNDARRVESRVLYKN